MIQRGESRWLRPLSPAPHPKSKKALQIQRVRVIVPIRCGVGTTMALMPLAAFIYGTVLTILGVVGFALALVAGGWRDPEALSALIPAGFGVATIALAGAARFPRVQRPALWAVGLLAVAALVGTLPGFQMLLESTPEAVPSMDPMARMERGRATGAAWSMSFMAMSSLIYLALTVRWALRGGPIKAVQSRRRRPIPWAIVLGGLLVFSGMLIALGSQRSPRFAAGLARLSPLHRVVVLAKSTDGEQWTIDPAPVATPADIPDLVAVGERMFMFYLDGRDSLLMVKDLSAPASLAGHPIVFDPADTCNPLAGNGCVDPAAVALPDGEIRLYFVQSDVFVDPALADETRILSARSRDGVRFTVESGIRMGDSARVDPDPVVLSDGRVRMYTTRVRARTEASGEAIIIESAISDDGLTFIAEPEVRFSGGSASRTVAVNDGFRHWYHDIDANLWSAQSPDGLQWTSSSGPVLSANALPDTRLLGMEAPGVVRTEEGWLMALSVASEPFWPINELVAEPD